jgi:hypothetical protein
MTKKSGPQPPQAGPAVDAGHTPKAAAAQLGPGGQYAAALDMWHGRKPPASEALDKAAAEHFAALKSMLTPERETALRNLENGKGSTLAIAKILQPAPHLLDMWSLPDSQLVRKVRELVQMQNAPEEWDGYLDAYWTIGQTVLWVATGDRWVVDQASNDSGKEGEIWGQVRAADLIEKLNLQRDEIQNAADKLRRQCLVGLMTAIDGQNRPIPAIEWRHLKIVLDGQNVRTSSCAPGAVVLRAGLS